MAETALQSRHALTAAIIDVCHRLEAKGLVSATDGNVSARLPGGNILTTRTGINKGMVTAQDLVEITPAGDLVAGRSRPSTETGMHLFIYRERKDVGSVVHAHPPYATGFATAREPLEGCLFPEVIVGFGAIPLAEYATPSTTEVAESLRPYVRSAEAILLTNHGAVTYGTDVYDAYYRMEKVEHAARITFIARVLGGEKRLSADELGRLSRVSVQSYGKDFSGKIPCAVAGDDREMSDGEVRRYIEQRLASMGVIP
ncbi:MAG TPA: class II aldolase/adducin family protein [Bacteroidota bacterium]|nr:class II aldolase/adducin family protein [Bacteroidota bacterium]